MLRTELSGAVPALAGFFLPGELQLAPVTDLCPVVALSCMSACHERDGCAMSVAMLRRTASLQSMPFSQI